ncbi:MAG: glycosyltransferase family 4 protein [Bordetella sp.]|uniref:glycosyltransferase family 4 protein n=1 Tax=Bordetella genomosp. 1 TaxID=1395607 RepID=UPI0015C5D754|nr:glycosyltransferase family 4 protein [Bordetella genomosp. 1]MDQ8034235.1 glycosyltransferase family 4 protein [Bordetella sp.]
MKTAGGADARLRIALLVDRFGKRFGGAEAYGVELARELSLRHDVTVITRTCDSDLAVAHLPIRVSRRLPSWIRVLYFAWRASQLARAGRFDIVHSHMNGWAGDVQVMHVTPVRYKRICAVPAWRRPGIWMNPRQLAYLLLERARVAPRPDKRIVAVSQLIVEQMAAAYGEVPLTTIVPGVRMAPAADAARRTDTRARLGFGPDHLVCLLVARNPMRKGLPTLLDALALLPPHYGLVVVGADEAARAAVMAHGHAADRVRLIEPTPDVTPYYEAADLYTHPTRNDSFGMTPLEAMAHRLPVIVSAARYCGFAGYLTHAQDALVLEDPRDVRQLADAITLLGVDAGLRRQLIAGGEAIARARSWERVAARFEAIYAEVLAARAARGG